MKKRLDDKILRNHLGMATMLFIFIMSIIPYARLSDIYLPSQMKGGFYDGAVSSENKVEGYMLNLMRSDCNKLPCRNEVYNYKLGKVFVVDITSNTIKSNVGVIVQKDSSWIKSAGIGGRA